MIQVKIIGIDQFESRLASIPGQVNFATAKALTKTVQAVQEKQKHEMRDVFDRPTPYTLDSTYVKPATKARLVAEVGIKNFSGKGNPAVKFLKAQVSGGMRRQKRYERALQAVGAMPEGFRAVPGSGAQLDQYGNIKPSQIVQILSWFKAFPEMGYKANMTNRRRSSLQKGSKTKQGFAYFAGRPGNRLPDGVWKRFSFAKGSSIRPVLIFVRHANYQAIFDFYYVAEKTVQRVMPALIDAAIADAIRTAK